MKNRYKHSDWIYVWNRESTKKSTFKVSFINICKAFLFHKYPAIDDRAPGCQETIRWALLQYMWGYEKRMRPILNQLKTNYPNVKLIELRSDQDVILFSENLLQAINQSGIDIKTPN